VKLPLLFILLVLLGCEEKAESDRVIHAQRTIDMSADAVARKWFKAHFNNSFSDIENLDGICLAWARNGNCAYSFDTLEGVELSPKPEAVEVSCDSIYEGLLNAFSRTKADINIGEMSCYVMSNSEATVNIATSNTANMHYVWEFFVVD
jgi:hypothetical protein